MSEAQHRRDLFWLLVGAALVVAAGIGLRDPWPADEPRFALIARDMVLTGDWLFPRVGGDLYPDKPPVYFWLLAIGYAVTGSVRASFLIPSFLAAVGIVLLVYDLAARLYTRAGAFAAAVALLTSIQFIMVTRGAQIDATLCFLTTLALYGLLRHLFLGPAWGWYFAGACAAGLGVVTKGVGFLPLLILIPYAIARRRGMSHLPRFTGGARWCLAIAGFVLGTAVWLAPLLLAVDAQPTPDRIAYLNEILFHQTVRRYSAAWHHFEPWYYYLLNVIPGLWMPLSVLLVWLAPRWWRDLRLGDGRVAVLLAWIALTVLFFSISAGKRGIYVFPALPALALAAAPYLPEIMVRPAVQRTAAALSGLIVLVVLAACVAAVLGAPPLLHLMDGLPESMRMRIAIVAFVCLALWIAAYRSRPILTWPATLAALAAAYGVLLTPALNAQRSASAFMARVALLVPGNAPLGLVAYKEQFLLQAQQPLYNFGHARWREQDAENDDAARWLSAAPGRQLLVPGELLKPCFAASPRRSAGVASGGEWWIVSAPADPACARRGDPAHVFIYQLSSALR